MMEESVGAGSRVAVRNAAVLMLAEIAGKGATLAYIVVAARKLGPSQFGLFAFALSFALLVGTLPEWGFDSLLVQRGSAEHGRLPTLLAETLAWRTFIAVPAFLVAAVIGVMLRPSFDSAVVVVVVLAATVTDTYSDAGRAVAGALQDQRGVSKAFVLQRLATGALAVAALVAGMGLVGLSAAYLAGTVLGAAATFAGVRSLGVRPSLRMVTRRGLAETGRRSVAIGIDVVVAMALFRIDQVLLGLLKGDEQVGVYAAAYRLLDTVLFVSWAAARAVFPVMSAAASDATRVRVTLERGIAGVALFYVPFGVGLWMEARPVLQLLYSGVYAAQGVSIVRWLAAAPMIFAVAFLGNYALLARNRRWQVVSISIAAACYNVGLNLLLIPHLSGTGAAIATTTSYLLEVAAGGVLLWKSVGLVRLDRALALPVAAAALMAAVVGLLHAALLVEVAVGAAVYGAVWFALARWQSSEQLVLLRSLLPNRLRGGA